MKIRQGFVSNSSSSSFCIYGTSMEESDFIDALKAKGFVADDFSGDLFEYSDMWQYHTRKRKGELDKYTKEELKELENNFFADDFICKSPYDYGDVYIGVPWDNIKDEETGLQFKQRIEKKIKDLLGEDHKCGTYKEAWYDG